MLTIMPGYSVDDLKKDIAERAPRGESFQVSLERLELAIIADESRDCREFKARGLWRPFSPEFNHLSVAMAYIYHPSLRITKEEALKRYEYARKHPREVAAARAERVRQFWKNYKRLFPKSAHA